MNTSTQTNTKAVLQKVHDWLGGLIRDGITTDSVAIARVEASELSDEVWDVLHAPARVIDDIQNLDEMVAVWNNFVTTTHKTDVGSFFVYLFSEVQEKQ